MNFKGLLGGNDGFSRSAWSALSTFSYQAAYFISSWEKDIIKRLLEVSAGVFVCVLFTVCVWGLGGVFSGVCVHVCVCI